MSSCFLSFQLIGMKEDAVGNRVLNDRWDGDLLTVLLIDECKQTRSTVGQVNLMYHVD